MRERERKRERKKARERERERGDEKGAIHQRTVFFGPHRSPNLFQISCRGLM